MVTTLKAWRVREKVSQTEFAKRIRSSQPLISRFEAGKQIPSAELVFRIKQETGGEVTLESWFPEEETAA